MKASRARWYRVVAIVGLLLLIGVFSFVQVVNGRYAFTPKAVSEFGFRLESTDNFQDGWIDRRYVSDRPMSEVSEAFVEEFRSRGYEVKRSGNGIYERIGFSRAGWQKAGLEPLTTKRARATTTTGQYSSFLRLTSSSVEP
ncbi:MAG: hypothetical protein ABIV13_00485 [Fimbriimonadales bacterium]